MSAALASAKRRRGTQQTNNPAPPGSSGFNPAPNNNHAQIQQQPARPAQPMNIQQAFALMDARIGALERSVKPLLEGGVKPGQSVSSGFDDKLARVMNDLENMKVSRPDDSLIKELDEDLTAVMQEVDNLKNIVLSLQAYTMDVNRMLLDERNKSQPVSVGNETPEVVLEEGGNVEEIEVLIN